MRIETSQAKFDTVVVPSNQRMDAGVQGHKEKNQFCAPGQKTFHQDASLFIVPFHIELRHRTPCHQDKPASHKVEIPQYDFVDARKVLDAVKGDHHLHKETLSDI